MQRVARVRQLQLRYLFSTLQHHYNSLRFSTVTVVKIMNRPAYLSSNSVSAHAYCQILAYV